jgi:hypothetical protein
MGTKVKKKKRATSKRPYDNFLDRDHSNDPFVLRKLADAEKMLGDGSVLKKFLEENNLL